MTYTFEYRRYRLPFRQPMRTARGPWSEREGVVVRLLRPDGGIGYGEAAPIPSFGTETVEQTEAACRELGREVDDARLDALPHNHVCLRHALNAARSGEAWKPAQNHLAVAALLPAGRQALGQIAAKADGGFRTFKWKVGVADHADELTMLDDICAALPDGAKLRLDANGAWDRRQAERWLERCADRPVEFVEQPCYAGLGETESTRRRTDDLLLGLARNFPTPIALDESLGAGADIERWLGVGWPGVFVVKPSLIADISNALDQLSRGKATVVFSSALESLVGAQSALRAAFSWTGSQRALGFGVGPLFTDDRFNGPAAAAFLRPEDVDRLAPETVWNALS